MPASGISLRQTKWLPERSILGTPDIEPTEGRIISIYGMLCSRVREGRLRYRTRDAVTLSVPVNNQVGHRNHINKLEGMIR
jgi:hypothetical protein